MDNSVVPQGTNNQLPQETQVISTHASRSRLYVLLFLVIIIIGMSGIIGYILDKKYQVKSHQAAIYSSNTIQSLNPSIKVNSITPFPSTKNIINPTITSKPSIAINNTPANWKTYYSPVEKATFKYPSNWTVIKASINPGLQDVDSIGLQSPSGEIKISWVSSLSGFGGSCDAQPPIGQDNSCGLFTLVNKTPISGAQGLYVISGTYTKDGNSYQPFLAIQDNQGLISTERTIGYDMYFGKNNGKLPENNGNNALVLFSTSNAYAGGPSLTLADANAWFSKPEVGEAKLILQSLTY